jgi:hypothetical protein
MYASHVTYNAECGTRGKDRDREWDRDRDSGRRAARRGGWEVQVGRRLSDQETLYDRTLQLQALSTRLTGDNLQLKARIQQLDAELGRKGKLINDLLAQMGRLSSSGPVQRLQREVPRCTVRRPTSSPP